MSRITEAERKRFHNYLDESIDKLNSPKNVNKEHWSGHGIEYLCQRQHDEYIELEKSIYLDPVTQKNIESECYDNMNFPLFIIDNVRGNK